MAKVELKAPIVDEISGHLNGAQGVVLVDYRGLTVEQDTQLRKQLREAGVVYKVYKNTLASIAADNAGFGELKDSLTGPNAIAFGEDETAAARVMANFAKKHEALVLKAGIVEGKVVDTNTIKELSTLPNREGMLSMLLSVLNAPVTSFARAVNAVAEARPADGAAAPAAEEAPKEEEAATEAAA